MVRWLLPLLLLALASPLAAQSPVAGEWALRVDNVTLLRLTLEQSERSGWRATLVRPAELEPGRHRMTVTDPTPVTMRSQSAIERGNTVRLTFGPADGSVVVIDILPAEADGAAIDMPAIWPETLLLDRAASDEPIGRVSPGSIFVLSPYRPTNAEMTAIFAADQADRRSLDMDWAAVRQRDTARRMRTRELLDAGALRSGDDFHHAAFVFQHGGTPDDYLLGHLLAMVAIVRGRPESNWIASATLDRYLQSIDRPQVLGTQYSSLPGEPLTQAPYNSDLLPDSLRRSLGVETIADQRRRIEASISGAEQ